MKNTEEMLCDVQELIKFTGVTPKMFRFEKDDIDSMLFLLEKWIRQCSNIITHYCHNSFEKEVPYAVENVCLRLTANMIALFVARNDTPVVKVNDWSVQIVSSEIFSDDLKEDLEPFRIDYSTASDTIDFIAITGDSIYGEDNFRDYKQRP